MWEFEFVDKETNQHYLFYGYTLEDAMERNKDVDFSKLTYINADYVD